MIHRGKTAQRNKTSAVIEQACGDLTLLAFGKTRSNFRGAGRYARDVAVTSLTKSDDDATSSN